MIYSTGYWCMRTLAIRTLIAHHDTQTSEGLLVIVCNCIVTNGAIKW